MAKLCKVTGGLVAEPVPDFKSFYSFLATSKRLGISIEDMLEIASRILREGTDVLDEAGILYWLSAGTALGLYRDGGIIPGDSDIDIGVLSDVSVERIEEPMLSSGFLTQRYRNHKGIPQQRAFAKDGIAFDVSIFCEMDNCFVFYTRGGGAIRKPKHLLEDMHKITFNGKEYPIPSPQGYLRWRYGDWQTPSDGKGVYDEAIKMGRV